MQRSTRRRKGSVGIALVGQVFVHARDSLYEFMKRNSCQLYSSVRTSECSVIKRWKGKNGKI